MTLFHERWRRRVSLLAAGGLEGPKRDEAERHLATCTRCREEHAELASVLARIGDDPARRAELPVSLPALVTRVQARLDEVRPGPARGAWSPWLPATVAALALGVAALALLRLERAQTRPGAASLEAAVPDEVLRRMEGQVAREQAARYLTEAQDVLMTVASRPPDCERQERRVDVADEARRSRELLARRALLVETERDEIASARGVLEDVDEVLREVASLPSCARAGELAAIHRAIEGRRLMMKIDLMTQELAG
jgi:hypothetical protein